MRKVLHVGPCDTPGGMATVMHTLADHPPEGWEAELLASHAPGGLWAKWRAYRRARRELKRRCSDANPPSRCRSRPYGGRLVANTRGVVLSSAWEERLQPMIGAVEVVGNPYRSLDTSKEIARDDHHLLLLARKDPVKGHVFAVNVAANLRQEFPNLRLTMTGESRSEQDWVDAKGWVSEQEKTALLAQASVLLLPSAFEGQPVAPLEALSAGLPVCVSDRVVGLPATVRQAKWDDVEAWTAVVREMLHHPTEPSMLQSSVAEHTVEHVQQRWASVYESLR